MSRKLWLSQSQMSSYTQCGMAYKLKRIDKLPEQMYAWTVRGIAAHKALENFVTDMTKTGVSLPIEELTEEAWDYALADALAKHPMETWGKTPRVKTVERDIELRKADCLKQTKTYVDRWHEEQEEKEVFRLEDGTLCLELPFTLSFGDDVPFELRGYIDSIEYWFESGEIGITDLKTGGDDRENKRQLALYRLAAQKIYGIDITLGRYWYSKLDRPSPWYDLEYATEEYIISEYQMLYDGISNGIYLANPSKKGCMFCPVKQHCTEGYDL